MSRVGQRLAMNNGNGNNTASQQQQPQPGTSTTTSTGTLPSAPIPSFSPHSNNWGNSLASINQQQQPGPQTQQPHHQQRQPLPPPPLPKPGWRPQNGHHQQNEEAIPSDSLYVGSSSNHHGGSKSNLAHWSSHGYLAKPPGPESNSSTLNRSSTDSGYVLLKRQGDQMVTVGQQPQSLPPTRPQSGFHPQHQQQQQPFNGNNADVVDRKYFSVRGFGDMRDRFNAGGNNNGVTMPSSSMNANADINKYYSVDARYHSTKMQNLPPDLKVKLRQVQEQQRQLQQHHQSAYQHPPQPPPRTTTAAPTTAAAAPPPLMNRHPAPVVKQPQSSSNSSSLEKSKQTSSVSWLEWTQQLQAYIAWVNSQLRKRPDLKPVQDLRTDLQSGEVLAQLIEIICKCEQR